MRDNGQQFPDLLVDAAQRGVAYRSSLDRQRVFPDDVAIAALESLGGELPNSGDDATAIIELLDRVGSPATATMAGGRYFGFVNGSSFPVTLAANWLAGAWDQNSAYIAMCPIGAKLEAISREWILDLLRLPGQSGVGFVTGATMANLVGLAAARHALLLRSGWDVEADGLFGAPPIDVVVGAEVHVSVLKALSILGMGRNRVTRVPTDAQGRVRAEMLPELNANTIVCIQAGNVNTGGFDPAEAICAKANAAGAWVHVDGAFGLWAAACSTRAHLFAGFEKADSWAVDAHKWLNVPYDCGIAICRDEASMRAAMSSSASYLVISEQREPSHYTPEMSRRARGVEIWAALRWLGREGLEDLVERSCRQAARFGEAMSEAGFEVLNDIVLNQVLVSFGTDERTREVISAIQRDGTCWCGGTVWQGRAAMRISVSSWATTDADVEESIAAILRIALATT